MNKRYPYAEELEPLLGREIQEEPDSVDTLNDVPEALLGELRGLVREQRDAGWFPVIRFLRYYVRHWNDLGLLAEFTEEVLRGGAEASTWRRSHPRCGRRFDAALLREDEGELLAPVADIEGLRWFRCKPMAEAWSPGRAAPSVIAHDVGHRLDPPPGVFADLDEPDPLEQIDDLSLAIRRWLASEIAWLLQEHLEAHPNKHTPTDLRRALGIGDDAKISTAGEAALHGLSREYAALGLVSERPGSKLPPNTSKWAPGFRGEDAWYR